MHNCDELRNRIWDAVEAGDVSSELMGCIGDCPDCTRELALAKSAIDGFGVLRCVDAPEVSCQVHARRSALWGWARAALAVGVVAVVLVGTVVVLYVERKPEVKPDMPKPVRVVKRDAPVEPIKEVKHTPPAIEEKQPPVVRQKPKPRVLIARREQEVKRSHPQLPHNHKPVHMAHEQSRVAVAGVSTPCRPVQYRVDDSRDAEIVVVQEQGACFVKTAPYVRGTRRVEPVERGDDQGVWRVRI